MSFRIVAVGKLKEKYWQQAADVYLTRLKPYGCQGVIEVPDEPLGGDEAAAKAKEAERLRRATTGEPYRIALSERGELLTSEALAAKLDRLYGAGNGQLVFWIGGAAGLDRGLEAEADWRLALSPMTLPHQLARIVLLEQLYRAERLRAGHPYHK